MNGKALASEFEFASSALARTVKASSSPLKIELVVTHQLRGGGGGGGEGEESHLSVAVAMAFFNSTNLIHELISRGSALTLA